jgi:hypothetical protein
MDLIYKIYSVWLYQKQLDHNWNPVLNIQKIAHRILYPKIMKKLPNWSFPKFYSYKTICGKF